MKYKIMIRKCEEPQRASAIAHEVSRWSGSAPEVVYNAITQKAICIRKEADEGEAQRLRSMFGAIGAELEFVPTAGGIAVAAPIAAMAAVCAMPAPAPSMRQDSYDSRDDDDDAPGRILTDAEYTELVKQRTDAFTIEKSNGTRNTEVVCMILAVAACFFMSTRTSVAAVAADFYEKVIDNNPRTATLMKKEVEAEAKKPDEVKTDKKTLTPNKSTGVSSKPTGGGDPRARATAQGVLGIISGEITGKAVASADIFGKGGFAKDIDAIISGMSGLKGGADGGSGRMGMRGIGFGDGIGSGFGGEGSGGINDLMNSLIGPPGGGLGLAPKKKGELVLSTSDSKTGATLTGGRSRISIQRVVLQNMAALRHVYNRRLRDKPGLSGKVTVKFAIDEFGTVTFAQLMESTIADSELETAVVARVRSFVFEKIDKPGDITEVTYPFMFSQ